MFNFHEKTNVTNMLTLGFRKMNENFKFTTIMYYYMIYYIKTMKIIQKIFKFIRFYFQ